MANFLQGSRQFIVQWNNTFPLDKWWRNKYKIPFGSSQHLDMNQVDILMEYLEEKAYEEKAAAALEEITKAKRLKEDGAWLHERNEISDDDFDKIVIEPHD